MLHRATINEMPASIAVFWGYSDLVAKYFMVDPVRLEYKWRSWRCMKATHHFSCMTGPILAWEQPDLKLEKPRFSLSAKQTSVLQRTWPSHIFYHPLTISPVATTAQEWCLTLLRKILTPSDVFSASSWCLKTKSKLTATKARILLEPATTLSQILKSVEHTGGIESHLRRTKPLFKKWQIFVHVY